MLDGVMVAINVIMFALFFATGITQVIPKEFKDYKSALVLCGTGLVFMANAGYIIFS